MIKLPSLVENVIDHRVKQLLGISSDNQFKSRDLQRLSLKVKQLSDYFTKKQEERPQFYLEDKDLMAAYLAYFLPSNLLKINKPLLELTNHSQGNLLSPSGKKMSILDLGCGPGTASLGVINFLANGQVFEKEIELSITAADNTQQNIDEANIMMRRLWEAYSDNLSARNITSLTTKCLKLDMRDSGRQLENEKYDLVILSNSIGETLQNETAGSEGAKMIDSLIINHLKKDGSLLVIEPALRESSRRLLKVRDEILKGENINLYSPCITQAECEALINKKDWCHEGYVWEKSSLIKEIDSRTGFNKSLLKYSYIILREDGKKFEDGLLEEGVEYFRVVSDLLVMKGEKKIFLCGKRGRIQVGRLDRHRSESNEGFDEMKRGDVVEIDGLYQKGAVLRINGESSIKVISL